MSLEHPSLDVSIGASLDRPFWLHQGWIRAIEDVWLSVDFDPSQPPPPEGMQTGDAASVLLRTYRWGKAWKPGDGEHAFRLGTAPGDERSFCFEGYEIELVDLSASRRPAAPWKQTWAARLRVTRIPGEPDPRQPFAD
ncbi:MAG TPA: hypothetical protein VFE05_24365 [Longimicrobiaceae bacterium]|jgi:hypothetical protein|nr:hypothetical protein [Longimicrobiaceae bacterium]